MPVHDKIKKKLSGLRSPKAGSSPKAGGQVPLQLEDKRRKPKASASTPKGKPDLGGSARASAQQRFAASGGVTSKPITRTAKNLSSLRRVTSLTAPTAIAAVGAEPLGQTLGETAFNAANPGYDPNFNPATSFANNLKDKLAPVTQAVTDFASNDAGASGPDFFPGKPPAGLRQPVTDQTSPALTPSGAQPNVVPAFQAPAATPGAAPPLPPLPRTQSTAPTFGEKQELRSARLGVGKLRSGFLSDGEVQAQQKAAQSRLDTAQAAPGLRVSAQTAQRGQDANSQAAQARSQAIAAKNSGTGNTFRDQLALYKQQYTERRDAIGDNAKAVADVNDSIDLDFGDNIQGATFAKALLESSNDPNYDFSTPIGRSARASLKSIAVDETNADRWIWDRLFGANKLGADKKLDFTFGGWSYDPSADEIISDIGTTVDVGDFSNPDQAAMVKQMIQSDNQGDQQKQGLR